MHQQILVNKTVKQSVWWWTQVLNLKRHRPIVPPQPEMIMSDAILQGWRAHRIMRHRGIGISDHRA